MPNTRALCEVDTRTGVKSTQQPLNRTRHVRLTSSSLCWSCPCVGLDGLWQLAGLWLKLWMLLLLLPSVSLLKEWNSTSSEADKSTRDEMLQISNLAVLLARDVANLRVRGQRGLTQHSQPRSASEAYDATAIAANRRLWPQRAYLQDDRTNQTAPSKQVPKLCYSANSNEQPGRSSGSAETPTTAMISVIEPRRR
ncbi:hypothetical protein KC338_g282 [Hortaea werneckii]|nr:hypothetical protein KC338_g282 [Hortaea werneckii]